MTAPVLRAAARALAAGAGILCADVARASPWGRAGGEVFISTRAEHLLAKEGAARFERLETALYAEIGAGGSFTLGGKAAHGVYSYTDGLVSASSAGVSEIEGFAQKTLHRGQHGAFGARLALGARSRFEGSGRPDLAGDGLDLDARLLYGRTLSARAPRLFAAVEPGYRRRFGDGADEIRLDALIGAEPTRRLLLLLETQTTISADGGTGYDLLRVQASAGWRLSRRLTALAGASLEPAGRGVMRGRGFSLSLWAQF